MKKGAVKREDVEAMKALKALKSKNPTPVKRRPPKKATTSKAKAKKKARRKASKRSGKSSSKGGKRSRRKSTVPSKRPKTNTERIVDLELKMKQHKRLLNGLIQTLSEEQKNKKIIK